MRPTTHVLTLTMLLSLCPIGLAADERPTREKLDPRGRPDERLINQERRYYIWHDANGWHLRSAAQSMRKFEGVIRVVGGGIRNCRPIGHETRGGGADRWALDEKRSELKFFMNTGTSFDGFDFDCDRKATELEFELLSAGAKEPKRIFIGRATRNPRGSTFRLPADPDKAFAKP